MRRPWTSYSRLSVKSGNKLHYLLYISQTQIAYNFTSCFGPSDPENIIFPSFHRPDTISSDDSGFMSTILKTIRCITLYNLKTVRTWSYNINTTAFSTVWHARECAVRVSLFGETKFHFFYLNSTYSVYDPLTNLDFHCLKPTTGFLKR